MAPLLALLPAALTTATAASGMAAGSVAAVSAAAPVVAAGTAAGVGSALSTAATIASLAGTGISALSQIQAGKAAETVGQINADLLTQEAAQKGEQAKVETLKISRAANRMAGEQTAAFGASGFTMEGSPLEVMAETARNYERDIIMQGYAGQVASNQKMNEADLALWQGQQKKAASMWGAGSTLLTSLGELGLAKYGYGRRLS